MSEVQVSRQTVDENNQLSWDVVTVSAAELIEGEIPYEPPVAETHSTE